MPHKFKIGQVVSYRPGDRMVSALHAALAVFGERLTCRRVQTAAIARLRDNNRRLQLQSATPFGYRRLAMFLGPMQLGDPRGKQINI